MPLKTHALPFGNRHLGTVLAITVLISAGIYNLTPFYSIDCWWHMKFGEYFLQNGKPVILDPFAVQAEKITATYPDLFPGVLFLKVFEHFSFLGLNLLRIGIFLFFIACLLLVIRKNWSRFPLFTQILLLVMAMNGRILLQPDLLNYPLFVLWIWVLKKIQERADFSMGLCLLLPALEIIWVNTHPLFFYHGLFFACSYFSLHIVLQWNRHQPIQRNLAQTKKELICMALLVSIWPMANPLGFRAFESLLINMLNPNIIPDSCRSTFQIIHLMGFYGYVAVIAVGLWLRPWKAAPSRTTAVHVILTILLVIPALRYERCLPFLCIYFIFWSGLSETPHNKTGALGTGFGLAALVPLLLALFLIVDRFFLLSPWIAKAAGLEAGSFNPAGVAVHDIVKDENIRETKIIGDIADPGNCLTNELSIGSVSVFFNPDKPFFWYGHAAVMNARADGVQFFMTHPLSQEANQLLQRYDIRTIVLLDGNSLFFKKHESLKTFMTLIYMDPVLSIYRRNDTLSDSQRQRIRNFYKAFTPGKLDKQRFSPEEQIDQLLYLWFSAEYTGNDGSRFLTNLKETHQEQKILSFQKSMEPYLSKSPYDFHATIFPQEAPCKNSFLIAP